MQRVVNGGLELFVDGVDVDFDLTADGRASSVTIGDKISSNVMTAKGMFTFSVSDYEVRFTVAKA